MSSIILPGRFYSQPQGAVEVDWAHPLAEGLVVALFPWQEVVSQQLPTILGPVETLSTQAGLAHRGGLSSLVGANLPETLGSAVSILAVGAVNREGGAAVNVTLCNASGDSMFGSQFSTTATAYGRLVQRRIDGGAAALANYTPPQTISQFDHAIWGATSDDADVVRTYWGGGANNTVAVSTGANSIFTRFSIGGAWRSTVSYSGTQNHIAFGAVWNNRVLTADEYVALTANPWQLFKKRSRILYFDAAVAGGGLTVALNQTTETDAAQPVGKAKYKAIGQVVETDLAQALTASKAKQFAQASETDSAGAITPLGTLAAALNQAQETDAAQAITASPVHRLLAQASETDSAQAIASSKTVAVAQATETDSAQAIASSKTVAVAQATETDAATALSSRKTLAVGLVTETEFAQAIAHYKAAGVLQVVESDSAHSITRVKRKSIAQVAETDVAIGMTALGGYVPPFSAHPINVSFDVGYLKQGVRAAYVDGAPGFRMGIHNQISDLMFVPGAGLMFVPGSELMFGDIPSTYPGYKLEVVT